MIIIIIIQLFWSGSLHLPVRSDVIEHDVGDMGAPVSLPQLFLHSVMNIEMAASGGVRKQLQ